MSPISVAGILLAAGASSRMGHNKMLLHLDGESLLHRAARHAVDGGLSPLIVVLGHDSDRARATLRDVPCTIALNPDFATGVQSSLHTGLASVPPHADAAMVLLADMPFVAAEMIGAMIVDYATTRAPLIISDYDGVNAPPMLYDRQLFAELSSSTGKDVVGRHRPSARVHHWPASALADIDRPSDYARMLESPICQAIRTRTTLEFTYDGNYRVVEPHVLGTTAKGNVVLRAFQVGGASASGPLDAWRLFDVALMTNLRATPNKFTGPRPGYNPVDPAMRVVSCCL
jgi:molybdenum cofactor cytidylyltransferase